MKNILSWPRSLFSRNTGLNDEEATQFISTVRRFQGNPGSHYLLACYYQERGRHQEAIEEFKKVLLIDPHFIKAYNGLGISYDHLGNFAQAIEAYEKALKLNSDLDYVQNNLGYSYLLQENLEKAIPAFEEAIKLNGHDGRFRNNLGLAYALKGQMDLAMNEFKIAGNETKANFNLAQLYYRKGIFDLAKIHYAAALPLSHSFTHPRTALEAAEALARIFQPPPEQANEGILKAPEPFIISVTGKEKRTIGEQLAAGRTEPEELRTEDQSVNTKAEENNSVSGIVADSQIKSTQQDVQGGSTAEPPIPDAILPAAFLAPENATQKTGVESSLSPAFWKTKQEKQDHAFSQEFPEIKAFLAAWKRSWEQKDINQYMDCYSKSFRSQGKGWKQWRQHKKKLNECYRQIRVSAKDVKVESTDGQILVSFRQIYRSDGLNSIGQKTLSLKMEGNSWKIIQESFNRFKGKRINSTEKRAAIS